MKLLITTALACVCMFAWAQAINTGPAFKPPSTYIGFYAHTDNVSLNIDVGYPDSVGIEYVYKVVLGDSKCPYAVLDKENCWHIYDAERALELLVFLIMKR